MLFIISTLLNMSAAGTAAFLVYWLISKVKGNSFSAIMQYRCLKLCLAMYLIPFSLVISLLKRTFSSQQIFFPESMKKYPKELIIHLENKLVLTRNGISFLLSGKDRILLYICVCVFSLFMIYHIYYFLHFKLSIQHNMNESDMDNKLLIQLKEKMNIRRDISVYYLNKNGSPFTYGAFHPSIVLTESLNTEEKRMILEHELHHIKSRDFIFRALGFLTVILHFYNIFSYLFFQKLKEVQELACDEAVTKDYSKEQMRNYGNILIRIGTLHSTSDVGILSFSSRKNLLKKRISRIGVLPRKSPLFYSFVFILMVAFSSLPVYAFAPGVLDLRKDIENSEQIKDCNWISFSPDKESIFDSKDEILFKTVNSYILTENGRAITNSQFASSRISCSHIYKKGIYNTHIKQGKNCTVKKYNCDYCTKCGFKKNLTLIYKTTWEPCPHK